MRTVRERVSALENRVAALEEEYTPDDDPTRSPEDVAGTWIKAVDYADHSRYYPLTDATSVEFDPDDTQPFTVDGDTARSGSTGRIAVKESGWNAVSIEHVDAPEVPADD